MYETMKPIGDPTPQKPDWWMNREPNLPTPRKKNSLSIAALCVAVLALCLSVAALVMAWPGDEKPEPEPEVIVQPEVVFPEQGTYITYRNKQIPVQEQVGVNTLMPGGFAVNEQGWVTYESNGVTAVPGIDVSAHQGEIDWEQVARSGIKFAMIRVGYRGYAEEGKLLLDANYRRNIEGALAAGLEVGVYFFSQATSIWEVEEELELYLSAIKGYDITYPVVFDWEHILNNVHSRTYTVSGQSISRMADFFCQAVKEAGYTPAVYFNQDLAYLYLDLERIEGNIFWLAEYDVRPGFYYHFDLWQYSCTGRVPGIEGDVDLNLSFRDFGKQDSVPGKGNGNET